MDVTRGYTMSKSILLAAILLSALTVTGPAFAFSTESAPTNSDGSAKFTDPDDLADGLSGGATSGFLHMFGTGDASVAAGMPGPSIGVVTSQGTLQPPYDPSDPTAKP